MNVYLTSAAPANKPTAEKRRETAERMRKWRASNAEKNRENDTRCRVYRVARERFGLADSPEKSAWINEEILRRTERRRIRDAKRLGQVLSTPSVTSPTQFDSTSRALIAWLPIHFKKEDCDKPTPWPHSQPTSLATAFPRLPPLLNPTPYNPVHLPSMEPRHRASTLDYISSQALDRLNMAA
ncbi:hypothetical protein L0F63_006491, partial [Massospora cicadina]